jgi:alanine racemase
MVANLNFYKGQLPKGTGIIAMVKALGYGSGGEEIARLLEFHRIDYLAVAYADEGIKLREAGISLPIMVLNPMPEALDSILNFQLEPEIYNFRILGEWLEACKGRDRLPPIHLKIDTGMHRLGFFNADLPRLVAILNEEKNQKLASVFSHMAAADEEKHQEYSLQQIKLFEEACDYLKTHLAQNQNFKRHLLNSAGILRFPQAAYDWVRLGIGLYGIEVNSWFQNQLQPVSTLKTTISQIKKLKARETVGYGRKGVLDRDSEIATIAIGYADGFRRDFSGGKAKVKVRNQWVPVVGNVCMDMSMIDVTNLMAEEGDEVIIFDDAESILKLSEVAQTIPYELLTGIGQRVKRIFYRE